MIKEIKQIIIKINKYEKYSSVVHHDTIARKFETDLIYLNKSKITSISMYVSPSSKVPIELIQIAIGKKEIKGLEQLERKYLKLNEKN